METRLYYLHMRWARCGYIVYCLCVCFCVCVFVRLRISVPRIKLAASHFARRFIGVQGRETQIFVNFAPLEAQNQTNWPARGPRPHTCTVKMRRRKRHARDAPFVEYRAACGRIGSACLDIGQALLINLFGIG